MTPKEYLLQAQNLKRRVRLAQDKVHEIEAMIASVRAIQYDKISVQTSPSGDRLAADMIRLESAREMMIQQAADYYTIYQTIEGQIAQTEPKLYRDILSLRYLQEHTLPQIARILNYSEKYIQNAHGKALQAFGQRFLGM